MSEAIIATLQDPTVSLGVTVAALGVAAVAVSAVTILAVAARRRLEQIDAVHAEAAAFMVAEVKRINAMLVRQRAEQIGTALQRIDLTEKTRRAQRTEKAEKADETHPLRQPLRKTIH